MNYVVEQFGVDRADLVFDTVLTLLRELATESDDLGELDRARVRAHWEAGQDRITVLAARSDAGDVAGMLTVVETFAIYANGAYGVIAEMFVAPSFRSQGVGKLLIKAALELGRHKGWSRIDVAAPESAAWTRTRAFYEREGFTYAGPKLKHMLR